MREHFYFSILEEFRNVSILQFPKSKGTLTLCFIFGNQLFNVSVLEEFGNLVHASKLEDFENFSMFQFLKRSGTLSMLQFENWPHFCN